MKKSRIYGRRPIPVGSETPEQTQARLDREASQNYRFSRGTRRYHEDLDEINYSTATASPKSPTADKKPKNG
jgi:hypothetical protein